MALRQVLARQSRSGRATSPAQTITWDSDGRCLLPRWEVDDSQAARRFRVIVELEDLDSPGTWRTLSSHEFEPNAPRKDGGAGMPSGIINFRVYDVATDLPREPRGCRVSVEPVSGSVILGLSVEDRGVQRDPNEPLTARHHSIALVQEIDEALGAESASNTLAFGSDITSGSAITVQQANYRGNTTVPAIATPTDSRSNSYTAIAVQQDFNLGGSDRGSMRGYYALNSSAGANTVTYTHDSGNGNAQYTNAQQEWSGMATSAALDDTAAGSGTGTAASAGDLAPTEDNELLISYFSHFLAGTAPTTTEEGGWSMPTDLPDGTLYMPLMVLYKIQTTAATEDADLTLGTSSPWAASAGSFKAAVLSAAITGTATASITEADIVAGGKTIIETLTNATFVPAAGTATFSTAEAASTTTAPGRTGNGDLTVTFPSGYTPTAGHFALIALYNDQGTGSLPSGGWAEVTGSPFGSGTEKLQLFWKVLAGGESSPVSTISGSGTNIAHCAGMVIYTGVGSIGAIGTASAGTGTPMTAAAINTTVNNSIVIAVAGRGDNETAGSQTFGGSGTGVNERLDAGTGAGNDAQVSAADKSFATSGTSSGAFSSTTSATDPWVCVQLELKPSTPFNDARQAIINGLDSAQAEGTGWDAVVKAGLAVTDVVRTSDTVVTITLPAFASYNITAQETITVTVPAAVLVSGGPVTGSPTFTVASGGVLETLSVGGTITPAGALVKQVNTTPRGTITPASAVGKFVSRLFVGAITPVGALAKKITLATFAGSASSSGTNSNQANKPLGGSVASSSTLGKAVAQVLAGALTPVGALSKFLTHSFSGSATSSGALADQANKGFAGDLASSGGTTSQVNSSLSGSVTPAGALSKALAHSLSGALSTAGALADTALKAFAGAISASGTLGNSSLRFITLNGSVASIGTLANQANKALTSAIDSTGSLAALVSKAFAGTITSAGSIAKSVAHALTGVITSSSSLDNEAQFGSVTETLDVDGSITPAGSIALQVNKGTSGAVASSGVVQRVTNKNAAGSVTSTGDPNPTVSKVLAGSVTPTGDLTNDVLMGGPETITLTGSISSVGSLGKFVSRLFVGAVTPAGALTKFLTHAFAGSINAAGSARHLVNKAAGGSVTASGTVDTLLAKVLAGTITPSGVLSRFTSKTVAGGVSPTGRVAQTVSITLSGSVSSSGSLSTAEVGATVSVGGSITPTGSLTLTTVLGTEAIIVPIDVISPIIVSVLPIEALLVDVDIPDVIEVSV